MSNCWLVVHDPYGSLHPFESPKPKLCIFYAIFILSSYTSTNFKPQFDYKLKFNILKLVS